MVFGQLGLFGMTPPRVTIARLAWAVTVIGGVCLVTMMARGGRWRESGHSGLSRG